LFLICNIVFASTFMLSIKWMHNRGREDIVTAGTINYIIAFVAAIPAYWQSQGGGLSGAALFTGGAMGISYFLAFFFTIYAVRWIGASGSTVISALSLTVPIVCGVFIWHEQPNFMQVTGIALALLSLLLIGLKGTTRANETVLKSSTEAMPFRFMVLIAFFALCGCARLAQAAFKHVCVGEPVSHFTLTSFMMAAVASFVVLLARRKRIRRTELGFGILMGLANTMQIQFIMLALNDLDSFIVFPAASAGALILTTLVATRLLSERLSQITYFGITTACLALILLNWHPVTSR
jgi:drug/metabolite transporter (DMT)-like permease